MGLVVYSWVVRQARHGIRSRSTIRPRIWGEDLAFSSGKRRFGGERGRNPRLTRRRAEPISP